MHKNLQISVIAAIATGVLLLSAATFAPAAFAHHHKYIKQSNSIDVDQSIKQSIKNDNDNCVVCGNGNSQSASQSSSVNAVQVNSVN